MRKLRLAVLLVFFLGTAVLFTQNVLFPFVYKIKEPFFAIPIQIDRKIENIRDLPIRHDAYGEGGFDAKRKGGRKHLALDLTAKMQSPVYASKSGWARAGFIPNGYGKLVIIEHPGGWETRYGHLYSYAIKSNSQWVRQGDIIGAVGKTGNANSKGITPHLHFEIRHNGKPIDPLKKLTESIKRVGGSKK